MRYNDSAPPVSARHHTHSHPQEGIMFRKTTLRKLLTLLVFALPLLAVPLSAAAQQTPVGTWTTIDETTKPPKSVVEIYEAQDGSLSGKVVTVLQSEQGPNPVRNDCEGDRKTRPIEGMAINCGVTRSRSESKGGIFIDTATC
jgi:hypothetical protein